VVNAGVDYCRSGHPETKTQDPTRTQSESETGVRVQCGVTVRVGAVAPKHGRHLYEQILSGPKLHPRTHMLLVPRRGGWGHKYCLCELHRPPLYG
jgi:hypothetical protein